MNLHCFICNYKMRHLLTGHDFSHSEISRTYKICKCPRCGLEQIYPLPSAEATARLYGPDYYSFNMKMKKGILTRLKEYTTLQKCHGKNPLKKICLLIAEHLLYFGLPAPAKSMHSMIDIGCGDGIDVDLMRKCGWKAYGFEPGKEAKKGSIYYAPDFADIDLSSGKFHFIRAWHVLEHVPNPDRILDKIHELLAPDGRLILGLPNTESWHARIFKEYWFHRDVPRHLFNYSATNIQLLLEKHGFETVRIKNQAINGLAGSIQNLLIAKLRLRSSLSTNALAILLSWPLELLCIVFKRGDMMAVEAKVRKP